MFRSSIIIRELVLSLAKVMLEHSVKLYPYRFITYCYVPQLIMNLLRKPVFIDICSVCD
jgi:hypothetical protein